MTLASERLRRVLCAAHEDSSSGKVTGVTTVSNTAPFPITSMSRFSSSQLGALLFREECGGLVGSLEAEAEAEAGVLTYRKSLNSRFPKGSFSAFFFFLKILFI